MKKTNYLFIIPLVLSLCGCATIPNKKDTQTMQPLKVCSLKTKFTKTVSLKYYVYLPEGYDSSKKKWPLVMFLHGAGERGDDLNLLKIHGPVMQVDKGQKFPFILVAPQCPDGSWWTEHLDDLNSLLDLVEAKYSVDKKRVYLTGISMGGEGTWKLAMSHPDRFAAIVPICGKGNPWLAYRLKDVPVWAFHGDKDSVIPVSESINMEKALKDLKAEVKLTLYPGVDHNSWTQTYDNPEVYEWLLSHKRK